MYLKILNETDDNVKIIRRVVTKELIDKFSKKYPCLKDLIVDGYRWKAITLWDEEDNLIGQVCVVHTDDIPADDSLDDDTPADDPIMSIGGYDVLRNVSIEVGEELQAYIEENHVAGFGLRIVPQRYYNYGRLASEVLGVKIITAP